MTGHIIDFEPLGRRGECRQNESLLACARRLGAGINSVCGGHGTCHSCKVRVLSGTVSKPTAHEHEVFTRDELQKGWRLACQTYPAGDMKVAVPPESMTTAQRTQVEGLQVKVVPKPPVKAYQLRLAEPGLDSPGADGDRLLAALEKKYKIHCDRIDIGVLRALPDQLRSWRGECRAIVRDGEVVAVLPRQGRLLGLAVDLGTTKIAGYLVDLASARTLAARGIMNPQISYGEDIISRMNYAVRSTDNGRQLQKAVVEAIEGLAAELCAGTGAQTGEIVEAVIVGNTVMHHLCLGLPVRQLSLSPFVPAVSRALDVKARDLGLNLAAGAYVHLLPNIAGFVGADHVAMLLAIGASQKKKLTLAIDIGTNTEVSLTSGDKITAVSCASGPAFEGGHIEDGMRAASGAIERLRLEGDRIQYQTIDDAPPAGICGSGILDALSQLYLAGIIDAGGRITGEHPRVRTRNKQREFVLVGRERNGQATIAITQHDIRELQLAKAAIRAGIQVLLEAGGHTEDEIAEVIIAGAFGSYIDIAGAVNIGLLPALPSERFRQVGNAAGTGARLALVSRAKRAGAATLAAKVGYIELAGAPGFQKTFIQASYLGKYRIQNGRRREID